MRAHDRAGRAGDPTEREGEELSQSSDRSSIDPAIRYFHALDRHEQRAAIKRLAAAGLGDYEIASATRLEVSFVRKIIGERDAGSR